MYRRAFHMGVLALLFPVIAGAQGRATKVYYDDGFATGSQAFEKLPTRYFEILTTPAPEDPTGDLLRYWGPRLDEFFERVTGNLCMTETEICRYLLYPRYFAELEKLCLEGRLAQTHFDSVLALATAIEYERALPTTESFEFLSPAEAPVRVGFNQRKRSYGKSITVTGDTVRAVLPGPDDRARQRCVLYRTLADFIATPIGPALSEGVLGFVPRYEKSRPVVLYASLGEHRLYRTARHEIAHAVVEGISTYLRSLSVSRLLNAPDDTTRSKPWSPGSGGFGAITHENFAEYLSFPHGQMDPQLRAALVEMVAENAIDGLAAMSIGPRTLASSYVEGPARLRFLAQHYGLDFPKQLLVRYYTGSLGLLDTIEELSGKTIGELEELYKRWLRETFWGVHLATDVPDTMGSVVASGWSGVRNEGRLLVKRARKGRQEIVLVTPRNGRRKKFHEQVVVRDLDGTERLPLFSTPDLRHDRVVVAVRNRNQESLLLYDTNTRKKRRHKLAELGAIREIHDPRLASNGTGLVFRVVDRSGRNAIVYLDLESDRARVVVPWQWTEVSHPSFADDDLVLFASTETPDHTSDVHVVELATGVVRNLTATPGENETEPLLINGHLVCLSDATGIVEPVEVHSWGKRRLARLPFAVENLQRGDSTLTVVVHSLRHRHNPAQRAVWEFPLKRLGLESKSEHRPDAGGIRLATMAPTRSDEEHSPEEEPESDREAHTRLGMTFPQVAPYEQKWRLMPLNLSFNGSGQNARGVSFMGFDTEFHDQSVVVAAGQSGSFDRFGMLQYRNRTSRTHWQTSVYHRSVVRRRYAANSLDTVDRKESEQGLLLSAQYHKSLVTRFGVGVSFTRRSDATGSILTDLENTTPGEIQAPILGLQFRGLKPSNWNLRLAGLSRLDLLQDRSPAALESWTQAVQEVTAQKDEFIPTIEYVRPTMTLGASLSRDTRVWSDYRGPNSGSLFIARLSGGASARGTQTALGVAKKDSLRSNVGAGLERLSASWLFLTHRRVSFVDVALRVQGLLNNGPQALTYGLGGIYSVTGYPRGGIRSQQIAWSNTEARVQLWDYSRWRIPLRPLVFPAADGFMYVDTGIADGAEPLLSYGIGLRLRLGFLAFEWRRPLRNGLRNERGLALVW